MRFLALAAFLAAATWAAVASGPAPSAAQTQTAPNITGRYKVTGQVLQVNMVLVQTGTSVTGHYLNHTGTVTGRMATPTQLDARFHDQRGSGWFTANFTPDGMSFSGPWGWQSKPATGHITGVREAASN